ncbi:MAG: hypothetical protein HY820_22925 [Acidobacteria bacterium]|nr:hypothetical protein [Acidobacteriota bacterium]
MILTIEIPDHKAARYKDYAEARGQTLDAWLLQLAEQSVPIESFAHLQTTNPEEWRRRFLAWADSRDPNVPVLPDEALTRESIYSDD